MVWTPGEVKVSQHRLACDHPWRPGTCILKTHFSSNHALGKATAFYLANCDFIEKAKSIWIWLHYKMLSVTHTNLMWFLLLGTSARTPGQNQGWSAWHFTTTRAPTTSCSIFATQSKVMWWPETRLLPLSSKLILYFNLPSSAKKHKTKTNCIRNVWANSLSLLWYWNLLQKISDNIQTVLTHSLFSDTVRSW